MKKPLIGVLPLVDEGRESYWMLPGYLEGISEAGGIPVMLPLTDEEEVLERLSEEFDGFLFTGGHDVAPSLYGEGRLEFCGACCMERDAMEKKLLLKALELDKPVLGICRGIQLINAVLGGTLYQDLPAQRPTQTEHHQTPPYDVPVHEAELIKGSPLFALLGKERLAVNSYHHQAIKELAPGLSVMAVSEDGLTEAVWMPGKKYVWAVQWHPEFSYKTDENSRKIFRSFLDAV